MSLPEIKQKLIEQIQASNDEALMVELLGIIKHQTSPPKLSAYQMKILQERINKVEEGRATYVDAREHIQKLKDKLNGI